MISEERESHLFECNRLEVLQWLFPTLLCWFRLRKGSLKDTFARLSVT